MQHVYRPCRQFDSEGFGHSQPCTTATDTLSDDDMWDAFFLFFFEISQIHPQRAREIRGGLSQDLNATRSKLLYDMFYLSARGKFMATSIQKLRGEF